MDLESIIGRLQAGGDETVYDDLSTLYSGVSERADSADAKIESLTAELTAANEAISTLKAHNYDLLMQIERSAPHDGDGDGEIDVDGDGDEDDSDGPGIDELYADDDDSDKNEEDK
jgi:hypothetical protein